MILRSLRWRLLVGAAVAIFVALLLAWMLMMLLFERHLERRLASELEHDAVRIVAGLTVSPTGMISVEEPPSDARYQTPASGLYWQVSYRGLLVRSPSLWDQALPLTPSAPNEDWATRLGGGPFQSRLVYLERRVLPARADAPVLVQIAQDAAALEVAGAEFGRELALFLTLLWLVLSGAAWLQVQLGLKPLSRLRGQLASLQGNPSARLGEDGGLSEVQPLIQAINALADVREEDLERARRRATDLAHRLKTPLAAASAQVRRAHEEGATRSAEGLENAVEAMRIVVEAELARTRIAAARVGPGIEANVKAAVERLVAVLERTEAGEALVIDIEVPDALTVPLASEDLMEVLGAIAENAVRFARRRVIFDGKEDEAGVAITVDDDGRGISEEESEKVLVRGTRLDESSQGQGLGLAIARELVDATEGSLALSRSSLGGLRVEVRWPISTM